MNKEKEKQFKIMGREQNWRWRSKTIKWSIENEQYVDKTIS